MRKNGLECECPTSGKLNICEHIIAVVELRGEASFHSFVKSFKKPQIAAVKNSGKKPDSSVRKGSRTDRMSPSQMSAAVASGGYIVVRKTGRIHICNGCKGDLLTERFVLQHNCCIPYPAKSQDGQVVFVSPSRPTNHYFHMRADCVTRSQAHKDFNKVVSVSPTILTPNIKTVVRECGLKLQE